MDKERIDYERVLSEIKGNFSIIISEHPEYNRYDVVIANERYWEKKEHMDPNTIYIVVKFMPTTVDFGLTVLPLNLIVVSEENRLDLCKALLQDFALSFNQEENDYFQQYYESPTVVNSFAEAYEGYRALLNVAGTIVICPNSNSYALSWSEEENGDFENIDFFDSTLDGSMQNNPNLFFDNNNYTRSINTAGTISINISTYLLDNPFINKCIEVWTKKNEKKRNVINNTIWIKVSFKNGLELKDEFRVINVIANQKLRQIPSISITVSN